MRRLLVIDRIFLGLIFFVLGLNGFLNFIPAPPDIPPALISFTTALVETGYFMPFLKGVETVCGFLLLTGFFVPLALTVLAPVIVNIFLVHAFLTPGIENLVLPILLVASALFIAHGYRKNFLGVLEIRPKPSI